MEIIFFIIIVIIVVAILGGTKQNQQNNDYEEALAPFLSEINFNLDKRITIIPTQLEFFVDDQNHKFAILTYNKLEETKYLIRRYDYNDLIDFELCEDSNSKLAGRGLASAGGALLFGIGGAVVGSVAGGRKIKKTDRTITVNIQVNKLDNPFMSLVFLDKNSPNWDILYNTTLTNAKKLMATLSYIKNFNEINKEKNNERIDISEKLKKLNELKEQGLITEEEFINKKRSVLEAF